MARYSIGLLAILLIASCADAQPSIRSTSVVNAASYRAQGMPGSGIAQGSIFTIFGSSLGASTLATARSLPLQTSLSGTSVTVTVGGKTVNALIQAAISYQVNAVLPSTTPVGSGTVTVTYGNQTSAPEPVEVVPASFAPFTFNSGGIGQASATDLNYQSNSIIHTFHPGDWVVLWGTGLGAIAGDDSTAPPVGNIGSPKVYIGNTSLTPYYAGRSAEFPGLDQVMFQVPSGLKGCSVPVAVESNGTVGGSAILAVSTSGQTCSDSLLGDDLVAKLVSGGTVDFGLAQLYAIVLRNETLPIGFMVPDFGKVTFSEFTPLTAGLASYGSSEGYCISTNDPDMSPAQLDAGSSLMVHASVASMPLPKMFNGYYYSMISTGAQFFWSGLQYGVSGGGGSRVGEFSVNDITGIPSAYFSGMTAGQTLSRASDLTVNWTGGDPSMQNGQVTIAGFSSATDDGNISGGFLCTAPAGSHSFTIPKWVLGLLPPTITEHVGIAPYPFGFIWIGQFNHPVTFQASGLDRGILMDEFYNGYPVYFK